MERVAHHENTIALETRKLISSRYRRITKAANREFWGSQSETDHSLYVGSYGRGTAIDTSDLDVLISLPKDEYERYDCYRGNGQSRLIQAMKESIQGTYPSTDVRGDGQVVVIKFSDGMRFEILPVFKQTGWDGTESFVYPDSHMGGNWKTTNPKSEQAAMKDKNSSSNGLLYDTCKHIRFIHSEGFSSYKLSGIVIDSFIYSAIGGWQWSDGSSEPAAAGEYEQMLLSEFNRRSANGRVSFQLNAPGSRQAVDTSSSLNCLGKVLAFMAK